MSEAYLQEWVRKAETVEFRYPGEDATPEEARAAIKAMREVRRFVQGLLGVATLHLER